MEKIVYKPRRTLGILAFAMITFILIEFLIISIFFDDFYSDKRIFIFLVPQYIIAISANFMYYLSRVKVILEENEITVVNDRQTKSRSIEWSCIHYAYYVKKYKGHRFLVLSPDGLSENQLRNFIGKGIVSSKVCIENVIVIRLSKSKDTSKISDFVKQKVESDKIFLEIC